MPFHACEGHDLGNHKEMKKMEVGKASNPEKLVQSSYRKVLKSNPEELVKEIGRGKGLGKSQSQMLGKERDYRKHLGLHSYQVPLVSVSWRIPPRGKHGDDHQPGFDMDYSPPKRHPPSHN